MEIFYPQNERLELAHDEPSGGHGRVLGICIQKTAATLQPTITHSANEPGVVASLKTLADY